MTPLTRSALVLAAALLLQSPAAALEAGFRQTSIAGPTAGAPATTLALYYPTQTPARAIPMGPFTPRVAFHGVPEPTVKGLILLSHGTGGSELGHSTLAQGLARAGYLVAALRHPGDNWQDGSLPQAGAAAYFDERPRQVSRVIDALLRDPLWKDRITRDVQGPRVGAVGHSAGGYTVLALAGGAPDLALLASHCAMNQATDPVFCRTGRVGQPAPPAAATAAPAAPLTDRRVRAVVALAPVGVVFSDRSLAAIAIPVSIYQADLDRWLVPRFHAGWIARNLPAAQLHRVPNAWHFAFMDTPGMAIETADGDIRADPAGFDRAAFLKQLALDLPSFFDKVWR